jgi:hypothetical protein
MSTKAVATGAAIGGPSGDGVMSQRASETSAPRRGRPSGGLAICEAATAQKFCARLRHGLLARSSRLRIDGRRPRRRQEVTDPRSSHYGSPMAEPWTRQRHRSKWERCPSSCVHDRIQRSCPISFWREAQRQNDGATPTHCAGSGRRFARCSPTSLLIAESELPILSPISVNSASERPKRFLTNCRTTYLETRLSGRCRCAAISEAPAPRRSLRESACG